jgi:hypothetical protein
MLFNLAIVAHAFRRVESLLREKITVINVFYYTLSRTDWLVSTHLPSSPKAESEDEFVQCRVQSRRLLMNAPNNKNGLNEHTKSSHHTGKKFANSQ